MKTPRYILSKALDGSYMIKDTTINNFFDSQKYYGISDYSKAKAILADLNNEG